MNADERKLLNQLAHDAIGSAYEVSNVLGVGFLEKVYRNALVAELCSRGMRAMAEQHLPVDYKGLRVGEYVADIVVADRLILELKCVEAFANEHVAQCLNYLKATGLHLALLLNFQKPRIEVQRVVLNF